MTRRTDESIRTGRAWRRRGARAAVLGSLGLLAAACSSTGSSTGAASSATSVPAHGHHAGRHHRAIVGVVTALPASAVDLRVHGKAESVRLVPATTYRQGKATISSGALKPGERVRVLLASGAATPTAARVVLLPATTTYAGTVGALTGTSFVITSKAGKTHDVTTTGATSYRRGTTTTTVKALSDGDAVRVVGEPGPGGSLTASKVTIKKAG